MNTGEILTREDKIQLVADMKELVPTTIQNEVGNMEYTILIMLHMDYTAILEGTDPYDRPDFIYLTNLLHRKDEEGFQEIELGEDCEDLKKLQNMYKGMGKDLSIPYKYEEVIQYFWRTCYNEELKPALREIAQGETSNIVKSVNEVGKELNNIMKNRYLNQANHANTHEKRMVNLRDLEKYRQSNNVKDRLQQKYEQLLQKLKKVAAA